MRALGAHTQYMEPQSRAESSRVLVKLACGLLLIIVFAVAAYVVGGKLLDKVVAFADTPQPFTRQFYRTIDGNECNIAVVPLNGVMFATGGDPSMGVTAANDIVAQIGQAERDPNVKGIVLQINSPGGTLPAGEMIAEALKVLTKPSVALIQDMGDSSAYLAASGADRIIASPYSDVGGIGVTNSFYDYSLDDGKFIQISAGKYKDAGNPDKPLTAEERRLFQKNVDEAYKVMIEQIAENRGLSTTTVKELADGFGVTGSMAIEPKLVDELGGEEESRSWFRGQLGEGSNPVLCYF